MRKLGSQETASGFQDTDIAILSKECASLLCVPLAFGCHVLPRASSSCPYRNPRKQMSSQPRFRDEDAEAQRGFRLCPRFIRKRRQDQDRSPGFWPQGLDAALLGSFALSASGISVPLSRRSQTSVPIPALPCDPQCSSSSRLLGGSTSKSGRYISCT